MAVSGDGDRPEPARITSWYDFVAKNFIYRGAWGLGSVIGLLLEGQGGEAPIRALELDDWPRSGLPWIAFWIKELITWGTLDPVAAFLLARGNAIDRPSAEAAARDYYNGVASGTSGNDVLDPRQIRDWVHARRVPTDDRRAVREFTIGAALIRPSSEYRQASLSVAPLVDNENLVWIDPGGYVVARSERPVGWPDEPASFDFELDVAERVIEGGAYRRHI